VLCYVVDIAGSEGRDPIGDLESLMHELEIYMPGLTSRQSVVLANKIDLVLEDNSTLEALNQETLTPPQGQVDVKYQIALEIVKGIENMNRLLQFVQKRMSSDVRVFPVSAKHKLLVQPACEYMKSIIQKELDKSGKFWRPNSFSFLTNHSLGTGVHHGAVIVNEDGLSISHWGDIAITDLNNLSDYYQNS